MQDQTQAFFVRRGAVVKGPVTMARLLALYKANELKGTDEVAKTSEGPWVPLAQAVRQGPPAVPVIESLQIKRTMFGGRLVAVYECPRCHDPLESGEEDWPRTDRCPACGCPHRLSSRVTQLSAEYVEAEHQRKALAAEESRRAREQKVAEREAIAARKEKVKRIAAEMAAEEARAREAARQEAAAARVERPASVRRKAGACWYCGAERITSLPQCHACRMIVLAPTGMSNPRF